MAIRIEKAANRAQPARRFEDLIDWQKAHVLALGIDRLTAKFPNNELSGLTSQLRRAAVSIPAKIAERLARRGTGKVLQHRA